MDIDVKNALDKVMAICDSLDIDNGQDLKNAITKDIKTFISDISTSGGEERFRYFNKVYMKNSEVEATDDKGCSDGVPESLKLLQARQESNHSNNHQKASKDLVAFFTTLGRSYMSSKMDRNSIDMSRFIDSINSMNEYADMIAAHQDSNNATLLHAESSNSGDREETSATQKKESPEPEPEESLEELLAQLDSLIGLKGVKKEVKEIINLIKVRKKGEEFGADLPPLSLHLVFYGNPGTGKTTVARLLAKIYRSLGVLSKGQLVEVDRGGLVAGYIGQTATKTQEKIDEAMGGILFIDEAYTLTHGKGATDFGQEAVDTILKAMEDHRDDFIVIVAGYPDLMEEFIGSNPGLKSRFNQFIEFEDYKPEELYEIFCLLCNDQELILADGCEEYLHTYFTNLYNNRSEDYANGRDVRNYFEKVMRARSNRLAEIIDSVSREEYLTIIPIDLEEAAVSSDNVI